MSALSDEGKLELIRTVLNEAGGVRALTDNQLRVFLDSADGEATGAIYLGALAKARMDGIALPDGTNLSSDREYWLGIARAFRPNRGGALPRADGG